jgi:hypothetical protein
MKKLKIILVVTAAVVLLILNISIISRNGKVEEMYLSANPDMASVDGQCYLRQSDWSCYCQPEWGGYCLARCVSPGLKCEEIVVVVE